MDKPRVLFLCTGNSARSQMAEAFIHKHADDRFEAHSAGLEPKGLNPLTVKVMNEIGIDISAHRSKHMNEFLHTPIETVITVCGVADQACPIFPGQVNRHHVRTGEPEPQHPVRGHDLAGPRGAHLPGR